MLNYAMYGSNLKFHRENADFNLLDLSKILGTSQASIRRWENGEELPNLETCIKLAELYGLTIDKLLGITDDEAYRFPNPCDWSNKEKMKNIGRFPIYLHSDEWEWQELRSEILRVHGKEYLKILVATLTALTKK